MTRRIHLPKSLTPETLLKRDIRRYLTLKGWFCFPVLQGMGAYKGISDIIALKHGLTIFIEVKAPTGRQSDHQRDFQAQVETHGGLYYLVRSLDELIQEARV